MKHIKLFEQFISEMKAGDYIAYIDDKRKPGGTDKEIMNDYSLQVMNRTRTGFEIMGALEDIEAFVADYNIILDEEPRMNESVINEAKLFLFSFAYNTDEDDVDYIQDILIDAGVDAIAQPGLESDEMVVKAKNAVELRKAKKAIKANGFEIYESSVKSVQEAIDVDYWADYNTDTSGRGKKEFAEKSKKFNKNFFNNAMNSWNSEAESDSTLGAFTSEYSKIYKLAEEFFKRAGYISVNIIHAMIAQES